MRSQIIVYAMPYSQPIIVLRYVISTGSIFSYVNYRPEQQTFYALHERS